MLTAPSPTRYRRTSLLVSLALVALGLPVLVWLALLVLAQALQAGRAEFWMMAWSLVFVVGAPALGLLLPAIEKLQASANSSWIVPRTGLKNP